MKKFFHVLVCLPDSDVQHEENLGANTVALGYSVFEELFADECGLTISQVWFAEEPSLAVNVTL